MRMRFLASVPVMFINEREVAGTQAPGVEELSTVNSGGYRALIQPRAFCFKFYYLLSFLKIDPYMYRLWV